MTLFPLKNAKNLLNSEESKDMKDPPMLEVKNSMEHLTL
jgi:hypothetical protein